MMFPSPVRSLLSRPFHPTLAAKLWVLTVRMAMREHAAQAQSAWALYDAMLRIGMTFACGTEDPETFLSAHVSDLVWRATAWGRQNHVRFVSFVKGDTRISVDTDRPAAGVSVERWVVCPTCHGHGTVIAPSDERWIAGVMAMPAGQYPIKDERKCHAQTCRGAGGYWRHVAAIRC